MKVAVVTGAGRGLGRLIAQGLADKGFTPLVTDIDGDAAARTADEIGGGAWSAAHDVRDPEQHRTIAREAANRGPLTVWVNNAGVLRAAAAWEHPDEEVKLQVDVNVLGVIYGARAAVDVMGHSGMIINIASISSIVPAPGLAVYGATKHAVLGFSTSLQGDLQRAGRDIRVSAICPDAIDTDMTRDVRDEEHAALIFTSKNLLTPEEVARRAVALVDRPRLVSIVPAARGVLAQVVRPFPKLGLLALDFYWKMGDRNRGR